MFELLLIFALALLNGLFSMAEAALIAAREARLQQRANEGDKRAHLALALRKDRERFFATNQIAITLIGILSGAFGGATLSDPLAKWIAGIPFLAGAAQPLAFLIVTMGITYLSLVFGELVPKQLAVNNPESITAALSGIMRTLIALVVRLRLDKLLNGSSRLILALLNVKPNDTPDITREEFKVMLDAGAQSGEFEVDETHLMKRVFRLDDIRISAIMTPRRDVTWLDVDDSLDVLREKITRAGRSRYPVAEGSLDQVIGVVRTKDLLLKIMYGEAVDLRQIIRQPIEAPESLSVLEILQKFKENSSHLALVYDEHGGLEGILTITDVLEQIIGGISLTDESAEPNAVQREDGSWLLDGMIAVDELKDILKIKTLPDEDEFQTLSGFVMAQLGRVPSAADHFIAAGYRFEVMDMDGKRVDKVLTVLLPTAKS
ncbi:MAG TPA: hemolysin family protein [Aggregatilineales bacterium]|nr:HlyC/CorC family transporter [Anaerolineales bacterium]HRE48041.1 hemolysin family protein [Aggregatilineales bacterium]